MPPTTWLRGTDADVQSANIGIHLAWRKANSRVLWRCIIDPATQHQGQATENNMSNQTFLNKLKLPTAPAALSRPAVSETVDEEK